jgi:hypothetical protein
MEDMLHYVLGNHYVETVIPKCLLLQVLASNTVLGFTAANITKKLRRNVIAAVAREHQGGTAIDGRTLMNGAISPVRQQFPQYLHQGTFARNGAAWAALAN